MICKTRGFMIEDPLEDSTGVSVVSLADIVAIDRFMEAIFNTDFRKTILGLENQPTAKECCETGLNNLASSEVNINIDNCSCVKDIYRDIMIHGSDHQLCECVSSFSADFLLKDGTADSITILKFKLYDEVGNPLRMYMLPLFAAYTDYNPAVDPLALLLDGEGKLHYTYIPTILGRTSKRCDINKLIPMMCELKGYGLNVIDAIPHNRVVLLSSDLYTQQILLNKGRDLNYSQINGIGFHIDENSKTLYMRLIDTKASLGEFPPQDDRLLLTYDNRNYLDYLFDFEPIYVRITADNEIDYNGLRFNEDDVETCDEYMAYSEANTASKIGRAIERGKQIPKNVIDQGRKIVSKVREVLVEFRRADDDVLRERIINDEFVPLLDNSMQYLIGGATTFGLYFLVAANPVIAVLGGLGAKSLKKIRDRERREKALKMIKDELEVLDEKIADAKNADDRAQKYALMRIKQNLEGKLLGITKSGKYVN